MASTQISPGVVVLERDLTNTVNATVDNIAAVVGTFQKGPVDEVRTISSERQLVEEFGKPNDSNYEYWFSAAQFMLYGGSCKVIRATSTSLKNSIDTTTVTDTTFSASDTTLTVSEATDFDNGDLLKIDAEIVSVTGISGLDITVSRGQLNTSAVSHAASSQITLIEAAGTTTTINEGGTFSNSDTTLTVTNASTLGVQINSYIRITDEIMQVTGISTNDLTVTRAQLGTAASSHTDGVTVTLLTVTTNKTTINETTTSGVTPPLIKNFDEYEATTETASNNWKWAGRTPGSYGNSIRVVMTDAGPDQILYLAAPTTGNPEHKLETGKKVNISATSSYSQIYSYVLEIEFDNDASLVGTFDGGNFFTAVSGNVTGSVVAYNASTRKIEVTVDTTSSDYLEVGDTVTELLNSGGSPGSASGDSAKIKSINRRLSIVMNKDAVNFVANQVIKEGSTYAADGVTTAGRDVNIVSIADEYASRVYGNEQKWSSIAKRPGTSAYAADRNGFRDLMHILVLDGDGGITGVPGAVLEKFTDVSKASDAKSPQGTNIYYKDVIKASSQYIWWGSHESTLVLDIDGTATGDVGTTATGRQFDLFKSTTAISDIDDPAGTASGAVPLMFTKGTSTIKYSLKGGVDGYSAERDKLFDSYDLLSDPETEEIDYIIGGPGMSNESDSIAKAQKLIDIANIRKDCIAFISPPKYSVIGVPSTNTIVENTISFFDALSSTSYAVFDNNYKYMYDKYNDKYRYLPCNADVAGLTLSTALNSEPWFSPAGFNRGQLLNAVKLAYSPLKDHRDRLYGSRINPIVSFPGQGNILYGDKTALAQASAFDRINVRRLFLVIERAISLSAKGQLFEINDEFTRKGFKNLVDPYLRGVQSARGIIDYLVVCDSTNNPAEAQDRGEFFAEIFVKPTRSINFITLTFTATRTGATFAEVTQ
jgi:hypothetical protein